MKRQPSGVVLYVEDNRVNFLLVEQLLMIWSLVELHHAEDGARALELMRAVEPDLVIRCRIRHNRPARRLSSSTD